MYRIFLLLLPLCCFTSPIPRKTSYDEEEARMLLNLAAGAYSTVPEACLNRTMPTDGQWILYNEPSAVCDIISSICSGYIIRSDQLKKIIIVFRGTRTTKQLLTEGWQGVQPGVDFYGVGKVNRYFSSALDTLWPEVEPILKDPLFKDYTLKITGHSLGGALASLAAAKIVLSGLRKGEQIRLVTFGQPRVGDRDFAFKFDEIIPYSFRVVHRLDIVPHLPACKKDNNDIETRRTDSKKCDPNVTGNAYHHGTEIWYPYGMAANAEYFECLGKPKNEDFDCSDSLNFEFEKYDTYISDHRHYFDHQVPKYGKLGCSEITETVSSVSAAVYEGVNTATESSSFAKRVAEKLKSVWRKLKGN